MEQKKVSSSTDFENLQRFVETVHRRRALSKLAKVSGAGSVVGIGAVVGLIVAGFAFPSFGGVARWALMVVLAASIAVIVCPYMWLRFRPAAGKRLLRRAKTVDDSLGWQDELVSALEFSTQAKQSPMMQLCIGRACSRLPGSESSDDALWKKGATFGSRVLVTIILAALGLSFLPESGNDYQTSAVVPPKKSLPGLVATTSQLTPDFRLAGAAHPDEDAAERPSDDSETTSANLIPDLPFELEENGEEPGERVGTTRTDDRQLQASDDESARESGSEVSADVSEETLQQLREAGVANSIAALAPPVGEQMEGMSNLDMFGSVDVFGVDPHAVAEGIGNLEAVPEGGQATDLETRGERLQLPRPEDSAGGASGLGTSSFPRPIQNSYQDLANPTPVAGAVIDVRLSEHDRGDLRKETRDYLRDFFEFVRPEIERNP